MCRRWDECWDNSSYLLLRCSRSRRSDWPFRSLNSRRSRPVCCAAHGGGAQVSAEVNSHKTNRGKDYQAANGWNYTPRVSHVYLTFDPDDNLRMCVFERDGTGVRATITAAGPVVSSTSTVPRHQCAVRDATEKCTLWQNMVRILLPEPESEILCLSRGKFCFCNNEKWNKLAVYAAIKSAKIGSIIRNVNMVQIWQFEKNDRLISWLWNTAKNTGWINVKVYGTVFFFSK